MMDILKRQGRPVSSILPQKRYKFWHSVFLAASIFLFLPASNGHPAQVSLAWDPSTGSNVAGYKIHYGTSSGNYQTVIDVGYVTTCTIPKLLDGTTYYFAATDYTTSGIESGYSNEVSYTTSGACTYSISPTSRSSGSSGGPGTVSVTASSGCSWTAVSNVSWITITSNSSATGNGTVNYSVSANSGTTSQNGSMTIAGKKFTVSQSGAPSCSYTISAQSESFDSSGGTTTISVSSPTGCSWTATSNVSWITITSGSSGSGSGAVTFSVSPDTSPRTGTLTIAGITFLVAQFGPSYYSW